MGFIVDYKGTEGYMIFQHPELILEFLVPARGRQRDKPYPIKQLGVNAQALRFMDIPFRAPIHMLFGEVCVKIPHPADFALHKLLICRRRKNAEKGEKDLSQAIALLSALLEFKDGEGILESYGVMPKTWQRTIRQQLIESGDPRLVELLKTLT